MNDGYRIPRIPTPDANVSVFTYVLFHRTITVLEDTNGGVCCRILSFPRAYFKFLYNSKG